MTDTPPLLFADEVDAARIRRAMKSGDLTRAGRGVYLPPAAPDVEGWERRRDELFARAHAMARRSRGRVTLSHETAALVHGLWVPDTDTLHVSHAYRQAPSRGPERVVRHRAALRDDELDTIDGLPVTSLERTVVDCVAWLSPGWGLAVADSALRDRVRARRHRRDSAEDRAADLRERWLRGLDVEGPRRGRERARQVLALADPLSESPGESRLRAVLLAAGFPVPTLQCPVETRHGRYFTDLAFRRENGSGVHVEYDGVAKYGGSGSVVAAEKKREDAIRAGGDTVVRVEAGDLHPGPARALVRTLAALLPDEPLIPRPHLRDATSARGCR